MHTPAFVVAVVRAFRWHRRWFAAIFAALAVVAAINAISLHSTGSRQVIAAAKALPGGALLGPSDIRTVWLPSPVIPDQVLLSPSEAVGQELVAPVTAGSPLTRVDLLSSGTTTAAGKVALPVRFADKAASGLLDVGRRVDILGVGPGGQSFATIAQDVRVVAVPRAGTGGLLGADDGELVMIEVDQPQAAAVAAAASAGPLSYALRS